MLTASMLLDPAVLQNPYAFYAMLREQAPVWVVPGDTGVKARAPRRSRGPDRVGRLHRDVPQQIDACASVTDLVTAG
ncbi:hypothetical protein [Mycobacterium intracellulare]|nr:hypothetical protein [Mycobacterium intracellulare]MCA2249413.1 hypothetical protein [Mycobacterium intracellulare]MCA2359046.1 hypothetical protein [Mycobacterium intracellulare]MCA2369450.1 hypothetical protein [Mycobacterium intracellulare]PBA54512.1 hypothetical protein CKJ57_07150 [Mycobacterium intracellulare subsp. chimaera]